MIKTYIKILGTSRNKYKSRIIGIELIKFKDGIIIDKTNRVFDPETLIEMDVAKEIGIKNTDLIGMPKFRDSYRLITSFIHGSDILFGYDIETDLHILQSALDEINCNFDLLKFNIIDMYTIFKRDTKRTISQCCEYYAEKEYKGEEDIVSILDSQLEFHESKTIDQLSFYSFNDIFKIDLCDKIIYNKGKIILNFGRYKGKSVDELTCSSLNYLTNTLNGVISDRQRDKIKKYLKNKIVF